MIIPRLADGQGIGLIAAVGVIVSSPAASPATASGIPLKRNPTVADIVHAVLFFLGDEAAFLTGLALDVDGGMLSTIPLPGVAE